MKLHVRRGMERLRAKTLIVFDLDGTLAPSKSRIDATMRRLLRDLLLKKRVAVISGGKFGQFEKQLLAHFRASPSVLRNLFIFPTSSTSFYRFSAGKWRKVYEHKIPSAKRKKIMLAFRRAFRELDYHHPKKTYGAIIEDRGTQITFSALGQDIVARLGPKGVRMKEKWNAVHNRMRERIMRHVKRGLPEFSVKMGGLTSVDVTPQGIDKAFGVREIRRHLRVPLGRMLFIGDAIYPGGNDYAAAKTGVDWVLVSGPREAKILIKKLLSGA